MELKKVIEVLKELPDDAGLTEEENWDESSDVQEWRLNAIEAVKQAVKLLEEGTVVGTLEMNGKVYKVTE